MLSFSQFVLLCVFLLLSASNHLRNINILFKLKEKKKNNKMGKKYYCDYCEKSFKEDPNIRKKHIEGLPHQKARIEHYAHFKSKISDKRVRWMKISLALRFFLKCFMSLFSWAISFQVHRRYSNQKKQKNHVRNFQAVRADLVPHAALVIIPVFNWRNFDNRVFKWIFSVIL